MITLKAIAIKTTARAAMQARESAEVTVENGIVEDFRGSQKGRQITLLSESAWQKTCDSLDATIHWTTRRANLLIEGIEFSTDDVGKFIRIGEVELKIIQETNPCSLMDQLHQGLKSALTSDWRGGVCCDVIRSGAIKVGDRIEIARSNL